jgi:hypothetical protein
MEKPKEQLEWSLKGVSNPQRNWTQRRCREWSLALWMMCERWLGLKGADA